MSLPYKQELIARARELRNNATPQEKKLWYQFLNTFPLRFQRQKVIDRFIVDFYCDKAKLVVEIDGSQHYEEEGLAYDEERTAVLKNAYGLKVIRFSNHDVNVNFEGVCTVIGNEVKKRTKK